MSKQMLWLLFAVMALSLQRAAPAYQERQESGVPHTVYGPPSAEQPPDEYGPPDLPESNPNEPPQYPPGGPPGESPSSGYNYPPPQRPFPDPGNEYGPPQQPNNGYAPPPRGNGAIPVEEGASERLRQQQFLQKLPGLGSSQFNKPQPLRNPAKVQQSRKMPDRRFQNKEQFQKQQIQPQNTPTTPQQAENRLKPVIVSGEYYVIEPNGRFQRVSYTTKNGRLVDGQITSGIKPHEIPNNGVPIYEINEFNKLKKSRLKGQQNEHDAEIYSDPE